MLALQTVGAEAARPVAAQTHVVKIRNAELLLILLGGLPGIDSPPLGQVFADQDDADRSPDIADAVAQGDHRRHRFGGGPGRDLECPLADGHLGRADGRRHGLGAGEDPAYRTCREIEPSTEDHRQTQAQAGANHREDGEGQAVFFQAVEKGRTDAQPDPVHEEVIHQRLREVVQLQLDPVGRGPGGQSHSHHDRRGDHAQPVTLDRELSHPDRQTDGEKQEKKRIRRKKFE